MPNETLTGRGFDCADLDGSLAGLSTDCIDQSGTLTGLQLDCMDSDGILWDWMVLSGPRRLIVSTKVVL